MTETETKTIVGVCEEVSEKNGWTAFHINVGTQYPVKLSTKVAAIIEAARAVGSDTASWTFKESQGSENPNRPGTFYMNRYLDRVEVGDATAVADSGSVPQRAPEGTHAPLPIGDRERSIVRQACLKAAATVYAGKGADERGEATDPLPVWQDETVTLTIMAATRFENWVMRDIDDVPF